MNLQKDLYSQYKEHSPLCDVTLVVCDGQIHAHRAVLAAGSDYFKIMFEKDFKEKKQFEVDVGKSFSSLSILGCLVDYFYGKNLAVDWINVSELLHLADILLLPKITDSCVGFLFKSLIPENCLRTWALAKSTGSHGIPELVELCEKLATERFTEKILKDAVNISPAYLAYFLDCGLASDYKPYKLLDFLEKYITNIGEDVGPLQSFIEKLRYKEQPQVEEEEVITNDDDLEECVIFNQNNILYCPSIQKFFTLPNSSELTKIDLTGIGKHKEYALVHEKRNYGTLKYRLVNLMNGIDCQLPEIPPERDECLAETAERKQEIYFLHKEELHVIYASKLQFESVRANGSKCITVVYMQKFNITDWKWNFGRVVHRNECDEDVLSISSALYKTSHTYFLLGFRSQIRLILLTHNDGRIREMVVHEIAQVSNRNSAVCYVNEATGDVYVTVEKQEQNLSYQVYVFSIQSDALFSNVKEMSLTVQLPHCKGKINEHVSSVSSCKLYLTCFGHGSASRHLVSFDFNTNMYNQLPLSLEQKAKYAGFYCVKLPKYCLDDLPVVAQKSDTFCSKNEKSNGLKAYRKRIKEEAKGSKADKGAVANPTLKEKKKRSKKKNKKI